MFMAAKDYFAYFFIGPYIAIFRNIRSDLGLVSARVLVGGSAGGDSHCFYNQYILPIICSDRFDHLESLGVREATILALMCLTSHNLMVESSVQAKTGSSFWEMTLLRLIMSFVIAFSLNWVMPHEGWGQVGIAQSAAVCDNWLEVFVLWFTSSMKVVISILIIVTALMILHYILEEFNLMKGLSSVFSPLMRLFGLPQDAAFLWLVGNVVGLAYGGAIMVEQMEQRKLSYGDGNLLNHHLAVCHSLLEDTIIFAAIGVPVLWVVPTRLFFAIAVVWILRGYSYMYARKVKHIYE